MSKPASPRTSPTVRRSVTALALSAAALVGIVLHEGYTDRAVIPVKGNVPTIGFGTTTGVKMGDTIIKEVPVYVPAQANAACTVNRGFVRLHDAAASGELPPAGDPDAAASGIAPSIVAGTVTANYQTCHETAEQLRALQEWIREANSVVER